MDPLNKKIIFTEKAESNLSEIMKINGLQESREQAIKILQEKKQFAIVILMKAIRSFVQNSIPEKDFILSLQKDLAIPQEKSEKLAQEIKLKVTPFLETITTRTEKPSQSPEDIMVPLPENIITPLIKEAKNEDIAAISKFNPIPSAKNPAVVSEAKKQINKIKTIKKAGKTDIYNEPIA